MWLSSKPRQEIRRVKTAKCQNADAVDCVTMFFQIKN